MLEGLPNDLCLEGASFGGSACKMRRQLPQLLIHDSQLCIRPLELRGTDVLIKEEVTVRLQGPIYLLEQMFELMDVMDRGNSEGYIVG